MTFLILILLEGNLYADSPWDISPIDARARMNKRMMNIPGIKLPVGAVRDITIDSQKRATPLRIYTPISSDKEFPVILFIHGGAWVAGNLETHDNLARYLCNRVEAVVVSVGYLNAPEGKFPVALEQCYDALVWIKKNAKELQVDPSRLAVVGDSAGGNMAAALSLLARDRKGPSIHLQVLINPVIDNTGGGTLKPQADALDIERWYATQYVTDSKETFSPYVSPNFAKDLSNLPSALILLAEKDTFFKDAQEYAERLSHSGVKTNVYTQWGVGHLAGNGARAALIAEETLNVAVAALRGAFQKPINE